MKHVHTLTDKTNGCTGSLRLAQKGDAEQFAGFAELVGSLSGVLSSIIGFKGTNQSFKEGEEE